MNKFQEEYEEYFTKQELYKNSSATSWCFSWCYYKSGKKTPILSQIHNVSLLSRPDLNDFVVFYITHKQFMKKHNCFDDMHIQKFIKPFLPKGFNEIQESCFEFNASKIDGINALKDAGFEEV